MSWINPRFTAVALSLLLISGCGPGAGERPCSAPGDADVLVLGDSIVAYHAEQCSSIADVVAEEMDLSVRNEAKSGARLTAGPLYGFGEIYDQYEPGSWPLVIIEGGVNDLRGRCGKKRGAEIVDELSSADGQTGDMPGLVDQALADGAQVVVLGYYAMFDDASFKFGRCNPELEELNARYAEMAEVRPDVWFVDPRDVVSPETTPGAYQSDGVHPTKTGSRLIGELLAETLTEMSAR